MAESIRLEPGPLSQDLPATLVLSSVDSDGQPYFLAHSIPMYVPQQGAPVQLVWQGRRYLLTPEGSPPAASTPAPTHPPTTEG